MSPAIETAQLTKRFAPFRPWGVRLRRRDAQAITAVDRVTISVPEGELLAIVGPNGAGKTTLVKMLCTLIAPTAGEAAVGGHPLSRARHVRKVIGLAGSDERSFFWRLTGRENLRFFAALHALHGARADKRIADFLHELGLDECADEPVSRYSAGQKQRLSLARALLHRPKVLFLDEPSRSLDPRATRQLHGLIQQLRRSHGTTVLLTTHRLDEAEALADRVAIMDRGRILALDSPDRLRGLLSPRVRLHVRASPLPADWASSWQPTWGHVTTRFDAGQTHITVATDDEEATLPRLIQLLTAAGATIYHVSQERPSLEEVFHHLMDAQAREVGDRDEAASGVPEA
ncbi:MAG: daunorubicin resistance protein DrrA family ABC transporter ATP-binding protein [Anaerolineae bacterium]